MSAHMSPVLEFIFYRFFMHSSMQYTDYLATSQCTLNISRYICDSCIIDIQQQLKNLNRHIDLQT